MVISTSYRGGSVIKRQLFVGVFNEGMRFVQS